GAGRRCREHIEIEQARSTARRHGGSLMDRTTASRIARRFITLPLEKRTVYLQKMLEEGVSPANLPIPEVQSSFEQLPLSFAQERQWFLWQLDPHSAAYHIPMALHLLGELDVAALERSFNA